MFAIFVDSYKVLEGKLDAICALELKSSKYSSSSSKLIWYDIY